jgi:hypothetical protein
MGQWVISIHGTGSHHNRKYPKDADRMAAAIVKQLREAGHTITSATITYGGEQDVTDADGYESICAKQDEGG